MLKIYNSLTKTKETFQPLEKGKIRMYVCGITVYDKCHLGHSRFMVAFDVIVRFLRHSGFDVTYIRNITDVDDKIIERANAQGIAVDALTESMIQYMHKDEKALFILPPDKEPRATEYIDEMISLIQRLYDKGLAYVNKEGDVCYEVALCKDYGKLSRKDIEGQVAGARVQAVEGKKSPLDFVLWKKAKPGEPQWDSPWGQGRPGWHIECSAMSMHLLGETFDIHGGGGDLQFPHHDNEIAQSEGATGVCFARYWMHTGMLDLNHAKMSKSTGNFLTIEKALELHHPEVLRYFLLSSHYRSRLHYTEENVNQAEKGLTRLYQALTVAERNDEAPDSKWVESFFKAMNDDFNTPEAIAVLFELSHLCYTQKTSVYVNTLYYLGTILGLFQMTPEAFLQKSVSAEEVAYIEKCIAGRTIAKQNKDWAQADAIRDALKAKGIELEDTAQGTVWKK